MTIAQRSALMLLRGYQRVLSPMFAWAAGGAACKFVPSCSEYATQAIEQRGALVGTALAMWRVLRCNPFSPGGFDPVLRAHHACEQDADRKFHPHTI
jgi:putative membrane protein insertion efficiency factor